jgi:hypothetical protein
LIGSYGLKTCIYYLRFTREREEQNRSRQQGGSSANWKARPPVIVLSSVSHQLHHASMGFGGTQGRD